jgi:predicted cupin superfamily sugar epimerase
MTKEIQELIDHLQLLPHIEGGYYKETYRSQETIQNDSGDNRSLSTLIYFLLPSGKFSKFHKIASDEIWLYQQGAPVAIHLLLADGSHKTEILGNDLINGQHLQIVIPANTIFGAEIIGDSTFALSACMVSHGFDFNDFHLYSKESLLEIYPQHHAIISHLHQ